MSYDNWKLDYPESYDCESEDARQCAFCDSWIDADLKPYECPVCLEEDEENDN